MTIKYLNKNYEEKKQQKQTYQDIQIMELSEMNFKIQIINMLKELRDKTGF